MSSNAPAQLKSPETKALDEALKGIETEKPPTITPSEALVKTDSIVTRVLVLYPIDNIATSADRLRASVEDAFNSLIPTLWTMDGILWS